MSWAVRISLDRNQTAVIAQEWERYCDQVIAYNHDETQTDHCHLLVINSRVSTARLKQLARREERGNQFWNFKAATNPFDKYITYMSKGIYEPFILGNEMHFSFKDTERLRMAWQAPAAPVVVHRTPKERYDEFERLVRLMPIDQRDDTTWIKLHARQYLFQYYGWINQAFRNDLQNYVDTYQFKYKL